MTFKTNIEDLPTINPIVPIKQLTWC